MTEPVRFTIPGDPVSKERPRSGRNGATYTPARTRDAEGAVRSAFLTALGVGEAVAPPVDVGQAWMLRLVFHRWERRPRDVDNMAKLVMDALNGHLWMDDAQVETLALTTIWVDDKAEAHTLVIATPTGTPARPPRGR